MKTRNAAGTRRYRDLLLAILLFIVLDLGILLFNFHASTQLERDAARINAAGELRMLTQQMTKALLTLRAEQEAGLPIQTSMAQLGQASEGFGRSLAALRGSITADAQLRLFGVDEDALLQPLGRIRREWEPLQEAIAPVLAAPAAPAAEDVELAVTKAVARNIRLAGMGDDLATAVEAAARAKTVRMRQIQVAAILLALLNFVYIVFKFVRRLKASDRLAEAARQETEDILNTVSEGLLLVRADGTVGTQFSASVRSLLMRPVRPGADFRQLLRDMLEPARAEEADHFLKLLFDPKVKPVLLRQLDPLREVEVRSPDGTDKRPRYLTFVFTQVREGAVVKELLVTVFDVTERVRLQRELAATQEAARGSVDDLLRVLENDAALLHDFLFDAREKLAALNLALRDAGRRDGDYRQLVDEAARVLHGIKGEAAALELGAVARQAHLMEDALAPLRGRKDVAGEDLIPVVFELSRVQDQVERLHRLFTRIADAGNGAADPAERVDAMLRQLESLSQRVAASVHKRVRLTTEVRDGDLPPAVTQVLREALPQLVRNAVVHGIEEPQEREQAGKPPVGELRLEIQRKEDGRIEVTLSDDGRGIAVDEVRRRAGTLRADADRLSDAQLLGMIFDPRFSTAAEVTEHAGRGDGLALVRQLAERAGAKLRVMTQPRSYTRFIFHFQSA